MLFETGNEYISESRSVHDILPFLEGRKCISAGGKKIDSRYRVHLFGI
jgi:hypothetical protein